MIPPSVRATKEEAFEDCSGLTTAILNNGLEGIGKRAFKGCVLVRIVIPPAVKDFDETAFEDCPNLTTVKFCVEIEEFISGGRGADTGLVEPRGPREVSEHVYLFGQI